MAEPGRRRVRRRRDSRQGAGLAHAKPWSCVCLDNSKYIWLVLRLGGRGRERKWDWRVGREANSCLSQWRSHMFAVPIIGRIKIVLGGPGTLGDQRPDVTSLVLATCNRSWLPEPPLSWQCLPHRILAGMDWDNEWGISLETLDSCKGLFNIIILGTR